MVAVGMAVLLAAGTAQAHKVTRIEVDPEKVSVLGRGGHEPPVPEGWARLRVADFPGARAQFAVAMAAARKLEPALIWSFEFAAVLARDPPERIVASLDANKLPPAERTKAVRMLIGVYLDFGEIDRARRTRVLLAPLVAADPLALALLHLDNAEDDAAALRWEQMIEDLRLAQTAVANAHPDAQQGIGTRIFNHAVELAGLYTVTGDRKIAGAAKRIYGIYLQLPEAAQASEARRGTADLDFHLAPGAISLTAPGPIDQPLLLRFLHLHRHEIEGCYRRALLQSPALAGDLTLTFVIDAGGAVRNPRSQSEAGPLARVTSCVTAAAKTWRFPPGDGTLEVVYPLSFVVEE